MLQFVRGPQSAQSLPHGQAPQRTDPGPPSSHTPLNAEKQPL